MDAVKKFRQRRSARLGIDTFQRYDSVGEYRKRRAERLKYKAVEDEKVEKSTEER